MEIKCGCHCIKCKSTNLESNKIGIREKDGYFDMHHTCQQCNTHFDHLDGEIFVNCIKCNYPFKEIMIVRLNNRFYFQ